MKSHSQKRFIEFGGRTEKSLVDELENLKIWAEVKEPESDKEVELILPKTGRVLLGIEYESDEQEISQIVVNVFLQGVSAASITVNGTNSKRVIVYRDITTAFKEVKLKTIYPKKQVRIKNIAVLGK